MTITYDQQVRERMVLLRTERPDEDNWIGWVIAEHEQGECIECDTLRLLEFDSDD